MTPRGFRHMITASFSVVQSFVTTCFNTGIAGFSGSCNRTTARFARSTASGGASSATAVWFTFESIPLLGGADCTSSVLVLATLAGFRVFCVLRDIFDKLLLLGLVGHHGGVVHFFVLVVLVAPLFVLLPKRAHDFVHRWSLA